MAVAIFGPFHRPAKDDAADQTPAKNGKIAQWTTLVEPSAVACDVSARIDLVEGLGALQSPWADTILRQALETEADPTVRTAIAAALSSSQSLVT
jgi:hypothetical protein